MSKILNRTRQALEVAAATLDFMSLAAQVVFADNEFSTLKTHSFFYTTEVLEHEQDWLDFCKRAQNEYDELPGEEVE